MVLPDLFSARLRDTVRDLPLLPDLGNVEGSYSDLVGQDLPDNSPILRSLAKRAVEYCQENRPDDLIRREIDFKGIEC